jgi:hypothetical protein
VSYSRFFEQSLDGELWEWVDTRSSPDHELRLSVSEGDDIDHWLEVVLRTPVLGSVWKWYVCVNVLSDH